jgi:hypothetical protein
MNKEFFPPPIGRISGSRQRLMPETFNSTFSKPWKNFFRGSENLYSLLVVDISLCITIHQFRRFLERFSDAILCNRLMTSE